MAEAVNRAVQGVRSRLGDILLFLAKCSMHRLTLGIVGGFNGWDLRLVETDHGRCER